MFFSFRLTNSFFPPYIAPAAISKDIPPSIGIQGGGQQVGEPPEGGVFPEGGGLMAASHKKPNPMVNNVINKVFLFMLVN